MAEEKRRKLNEDEIKVSSFQIGKMKDDLGIYQSELKFRNVLLDWRLSDSYRMQRKAVEKERKELEMAVKQLTENIRVLEDQIKNGVIVKNNVNKEDK